MFRSSTQTTRRTSIRLLAAIAALSAAALVASPAHAEGRANHFRAEGQLQSLPAPVTGSAATTTTAGATPLNVNVHPSRAWTADYYSGYARTTFYRGEGLRLAFSVNSSRTRTAKVSIVVRRPGYYCILPWPYTCGQVLFDGWVTFPAGYSAKYLRAVTEYRDPTGQWYYEMQVDEDGRPNGNEEVVATTFVLR